ncbi:trypsin-like peptidase domain-containing protein [Agromyces sp. ZXT2-6]|uniref:trypsin-like peptidase domain-containing protein n=1 Tax=Agromyces sp. ZXT2-6 TaxID=3461153 RepID=UPI0040550DEA
MLLPPREYLASTVRVQSTLRDESTGAFRVGTGLRVDGDEHGYLVTAGHLVPAETTADLRIGHMGTAGADDFRDAERIDDPDMSVDDDIAVFRMPKGGFPFERLNRDGSFLGQDVLIAGYPWGRSFRVGTEVEGLTLPMIKKGVLSTFPAWDVPRFYIDVVANPGFSGAPVMYDGPGGVARIAGMVTRTATLAVDSHDLAASAYADFTEAVEIARVVEHIRRSEG